MKFQFTKIQSYAAALAAIALFCGSAATAVAGVIVIDDSVAGSAYDGEIDGFPGLAPMDGVADLLGNPLGVALAAGATEQRAIIELPLAPLAGFAADDIVGATLSFNIDDVVSTFGPGIAFDGTAAENFVLFDYAGNGAIDLADFANVAGAPLAIVDTTSFGVITDASLAISGPLVFDVDITQAIKDRLVAGDTFLGVVIATSDDATGTSLDNMGDGGAGPSNVNGSFLPLVTIVTASTEPPVFTRSELRCQKAIASAGAKFAKTAHKELGKCLSAVLVAVSKGKAATTVEMKCREGIDPADAGSKMQKAATKALTKITGGCQAIAPAAVGSPCSSVAADGAAIAACIVDDHRDRAEQMIRAEFAAACDLLAAVNLDSGFPEVCLIP